VAEAHLRIDEGIKRGPRKPKAPNTALQAPQRTLSVALRPLHNLSPEDRQRIANSVLERYINGEQVAAIAPEHNLSDVTIYALLLREHEGTWSDIQKARALARLERSQEQLKTADDALSLARARELVRSAQWELERLLSRLYGQKQEVKVDIDMTVTVEHSLAEEAKSLIAKIRGKPVSVLPNTPIDVLPINDNIINE